MKLAMITDTHFGARSDSLIFADYFNRFYYEFFFPYLKENGIDHLFHLGDVVDRRKYINYVTARNLKKFVSTCHESGIKLHVIVGNHDTTFKNTNDYNSMNELFSHSSYDITYYSDPADVTLHDGTKIAVLPWVCSGNYEQSMQFIKDTDAQILFGHLEIKGFEMYRGSVNDHGLDTGIFDKFDMVMSGHFHHKSTRGNINYLGAPYEMSWSDYDDYRGFHVFDTEKRELTFIQNPYIMFHKIRYNDEAKSLEELMDLDIDRYRGSYVKVIVISKTNPYWFDLFIDKLEKSGAVDIQVVEDNLNLNLEDDDDIAGEIEDTSVILRKVVESMDTGVDKTRLGRLFNDLYNEASNLE